MITNIEHLWPNLITRPPSHPQTAGMLHTGRLQPHPQHLNSFKLLLHRWLKNDTHIAIYRLMQSIPESILTENGKTLRPELWRCPCPAAGARHQLRYSAPRHQSPPSPICANIVEISLVQFSQSTFIYFLISSN